MVDLMIIQSWASIFFQRGRSASNIESVVVVRWFSQSWPLSQSTMSEVHVSKLVPSYMSIESRALAQLKQGNQGLNQPLVRLEERESTRNRLSKLETVKRMSDKAQQQQVRMSAGRRSLQWEEQLERRSQMPPLELEVVYEFKKTQREDQSFCR